MAQTPWHKHYDMDEVVCPYCGYEFRDSWELLRDESDGAERKVECHNEECGKEFTIQKNVHVGYTSYTNEEDCEHDGNIYCDKCRAKI